VTVRALRFAAVLSGLALATVAAGTPADRLLRYGGGGEGKVVFDGRTHAAAGLVCNDCHLSLFATKKEALVTRADHDSGRRCFACHDGKRAPAACGGCHRKA
jgi:phosphate transport system substrate-binding protein